MKSFSLTNIRLRKQNKIFNRFQAIYAFLLALSIILGSATLKKHTNYLAVDASELLGTWQVDLRAKPSDPPYYQEFVVTSVDKGSFTGTFYNSVIREGRVNTDWGYVAFAFVTSDGQADYNTSGKLIEGKLEGATHSLGRDFMLPWRAEKKKTQK